jgi:hypothetical protein
VAPEKALMKDQMEVAYLKKTIVEQTEQLITQLT